ncbi:MAG: APC family permease [Candidatus Aureabacteria bacterium]|nr:APC family permease [Candidatus Auribacterota bacterium]
MHSKPSLLNRLKILVIGAAHSPHDKAIFHKLSLIAFFAWVGLGADGLSSSCYGPQEAFLALQGRIYLAIFVALGTALTVFIISASYSQIIELFPTGGGGYLVASKLLSPTLGMVSGCALLVDYVLTITISIASGSDAIFSFLPPEWYSWKPSLAVGGVAIITVLNLRGVKESVLPLVPIFLIFVITHVFSIIYALGAHFTSLPMVAKQTVAEVQRASAELGFVGMLFLMLRAYSMGAGTYTGIEAVSNGLPILREPKVQTGKRTMRYMAVSLAFMAMGLMFAFILFGAQLQAGKTLNAVLFERIAGDWGRTGYLFVLITLISEAAILFVAAQTGFLDGPRVLANMAMDRWVPTRFAMLSDRLVTQNGILLMGAAGLALMLLSRGSVRFLIVLYSINVFITFVLSQLGMVRHWWRSREKFSPWRKKLFVNGVGLVLCVFILISVTIAKFNEGGWITLAVTGTLIAIVIAIKSHYTHTARLLRNLDALIAVTESSSPEIIPGVAPRPRAGQDFDPQARTAVVLVNGFNGMGLHTLFSIFRMFGDVFRNFVFVQIGLVDAGVFKGAHELDQLEGKVKSDLDRYVSYMQKHGYYAEGISHIGTDVVDEITQLGTKILDRFPQAIFFAGRLAFPQDSFLSRWLHNYVVSAIQKKFYSEGIPFFVLPIRMYATPKSVRENV